MLHLAQVLLSCLTSAHVSSGCPYSSSADMAVTFQRLRARIAVANLNIIDAKDVDEITWHATSVTQGLAVADLYKSGAILDNEQRSTLVSSVSSIPWHPENRVVMINIATGAAKTLLGKSFMRTKQQDYTRCWMYFPVLAHTYLPNKDEAGAAKLDLIIGVLSNMGLRKASEFTFKMMTAIWLFFTESKDSRESMGQMQKWHMKEFVKREFRKQVERIPDPPSWCHELPSQPSHFLEEHPQMFESTFGSTVVVLHPLEDFKDILKFDSTLPCRKPQGLEPAKPAEGPFLQLAVPGSEAAMGPRFMQDVAMTMMKGMTDMQESNFKMMKSMLQPPGQETESGLAALARRNSRSSFGSSAGEDSPRTPNRRTPSINDPDSSQLERKRSRWMLGDEAHVEEVGDGVEEVEIPRPSRAETLFIEILPPRPSAVQDASASPSSLVAVVPAPSPVPAEKPAPSPVPAEKPTVMDILGALNERDAESKEAKKEEQKAERKAKAEEKKKRRKWRR